MTEYIVPRVKCCAYANAFIIAEFNLTDKEYENSRAFFECSPCWFIRGGTREWNGYHESGYVSSVIKYCPSCGQKLPGFERIPDINEKDFPIIDAGGEWCETCNCRANECSCEHPVKMWRIKDE